MKKILALLLAMVMVVCMFAACGKTEEAPAPAETQAAAPTETQAAPAETEAEEVEDVAELEIMFWTLSGIIPKDVDMVEDAINAITEEKINAVINLNIVEMGTYYEQVNLMMASQEKLDLLVTLPGGPAHFNSLTAQNQLKDITDLIQEYGQGILETVPAGWLEGTKVNGRLYSVTSMGDKATPLAFACRTDILEETGIDYSTIKTAEDLEVLFAKVKELYPQMSPVAVGSAKILTTPYFIDADTGLFVKYDGLGEGDNSILGMMPETGTTIGNNYTNRHQLNSYAKFKEWYDKGWVYLDGPTYMEGAEALIAGNQSFGTFRCVGVGTESAFSITCANPMTYIWLDDEAEIGSGALRKFSWSIPVTSDEPEAAMKMMNLLYTDAEIVNLLTWGIEGTHYQTLEDGSIDFLDGQDANSCGYYIGDGTSIWGNGFLAKVRKGQNLNLREECYEVNMNAKVSEYLGFSFDQTGLENEISMMTMAIEQYRPTLQCGLYSDEFYNEFMTKLKDSGIEEYIAAAQEQLDAWIAENK